MKADFKYKKVQYWRNWTLLSFGIIPVSYGISLIVVLLVHGAFGFNQVQGGTYLSQTVMQVAGGAIIGLGTGLYQRSLLKKIFNVSASWIYSLVIGFAFNELIVCIILWQLGLNRYELRFIEFNPLPETLIFACAGLMTGLLQWSILRRYFYRSVFWVLASTLGWGICILMTVFQHYAILGFIIGALLYGAITGATLLLILQKKEEDTVQHPIRNE